MSPLARIRQVAACSLLLFPLAGAAAEPPAPLTAAAPVSPAAADGTVRLPSPVSLSPGIAAEIARSALLIVEATATGDSLQLRIRRSADRSPITAEGLAVTVDGKSETVSPAADGYILPIEDLRDPEGKAAGKDLDVVVAHDGIREILSGKVALGGEKDSGSSLLKDHRQIACLIVNIVVVFIAALAISRRKG
jgi:hypothetical protein